MEAAHESFRSLDQRRRQLGMSYAVLAKRSGVSMATVVRTLSGKHPEVGFGSVVRIATALGVRIQLTPRMSAQELRRQQAEEKARRLVGLVQGTAGLEGQAVGPEALAELTQETADTLLAGSRRNLWSD